MARLAGGYQRHAYSGGPWHQPRAHQAGGWYQEVPASLTRANKAGFRKRARRSLVWREWVTGLWFRLFNPFFQVKELMVSYVC